MSKRVPFARERKQITDSGGATPALTASVYAGDASLTIRPETACRAEVLALDQPFTYTRTGATPNSTTGQRAAAGDTVILDTAIEIAQFRAVTDPGQTANIEVVYLR